ncbi:alpha-L-fucosidase [Marinoscillum pacificum]|uniref:alpha-L-fucosidase n=1 Tax=Marinoscillum pacificum TaxID=392723 RepID=UPI002157ED72|nr:alpha-L-fucosidase [Marinoscillum pacificum]
MRILFYSITLLFLVTYACQPVKTEKKFKVYAENWDSLAAYEEAPEWFRNAKFGIYYHWGLLSVPAYANDWHPRGLHIVGSDDYNQHVETYGHPSEFGYHDFVPMFKADSFNADAWADLFVRSGARFSGVVAEHHDGWSNWDSDINPWNAMDMGPHRDLVGELEKAIKARDLKFVTTFHMARNLQIYQNDSANWLNDKSYFPYHPDMPTSSTDSLIRILYGNIPREQFYENWLGKLKEVIDNYSPDLIYFDGELSKLPDSLKLQFVTHYLNHAAANDKGVVITHKNGELPKEVSLKDLEKGRMDEKTDYFWLTDETIAHGSWSYTETLEVKPASEIIQVLIDIVSKNGVMMLNISPKANGVIPQKQQAALLEIGDWLNQFGEAIYDTRTWTVYGEGPTVLGESGHFLEWKAYTPNDIRFTTKSNVLYAIVMGWPGDSVEQTITSINQKNLSGQKIASLEMLGSNETIQWTLGDTGLTYTTPTEAPSTTAVVLKITLE